MTTYTYEMRVPDDVPDHELDFFRDLAIATWRTGSEGLGGSPGEPSTSLRPLDEPITITNPGSGEVLEICSRVWRVEGDVT